jgi:zinc/manganese transport system substrate-binding protein
MRRRPLIALALTAAGGVLPAPALRAQPASSPLSVVASFSLLADMAAEIAGTERGVRIRAIVGPDRDAHGFQPRPSDAEALRGAGLVLRNGLGFDAWIDRLIRSAGYRGPVATMTEGLDARSMAAHDHGHSHGAEGGVARRRQHAVGSRLAPDPHAWQDLRLGQHYVRRIAEALAGADPAGAATYRARAEAYAARLAALDAWVRAQVATVPEARRKVVTSHDAFGYFGAAYGVEFLAPQGISTEAEPSAQEVARLIRQIRQEGITAVFLENMANPATLERLAREAGVRVSGRLYADALSTGDGPAPNYEAMIRHNVTLLVRAMRGGA